MPLLTLFFSQIEWLENTFTAINASTEEPNDEYMNEYYDHSTHVANEADTYHYNEGSIIHNEHHIDADNDGNAYYTEENGSYHNNEDNSYLDNYSDNETLSYYESIEDESEDTVRFWMDNGTICEERNGETLDSVGVAV